MDNGKVDHGVEQKQIRTDDKQSSRGQSPEVRMREEGGSAVVDQSGLPVPREAHHCSNCGSVMVANPQMKRWECVDEQCGCVEKMKK